MKRDAEEKFYRVYVTDQLQNIPRGMALQKRWGDIVMPELRDEKSAEDIANGVIERMGLGVKSNEPT